MNHKIHCMHRLAHRMLSTSAVVSSTMEDRMMEALRKRQLKGNLRSLQRPQPSAIDFSSNDYLGLASDPRQIRAVDTAYNLMKSKMMSHGTPLPLGATGSRLLSGDHNFTHDLEDFLSQVHGSKAALLFNSGYDANLSVVSCLACDVVVYDELIHNSLHMGLRLWISATNNKHFSQERRRTAIPFRHNDVQDLQRILRENQNACVVVLLESVYSMDGDIGPVHTVLDLAQEYGAKVVCDEAHGLGVLGPTGALASSMHPSLAFSIYTYGKAAGAHGAVVCCPTIAARDYLVNYAYPFIYSTALPPHALAVIRAAYETLTSKRGDDLREKLRDSITEFKRTMQPILQRYKNHGLYLVPSETPIQALVIPGNTLCSNLCDIVYDRSMIRLFPIRRPTVAVERIRIVLHAHNSFNQIHKLTSSLEEALGNIYGNPQPRL